MRSVNWLLSPVLEISEPCEQLELGFIDINGSMTEHHHGLFLHSDLFVCVCGFIFPEPESHRVTSV